MINIGSIDGLRTPIFDTHSYGPSKAAVHALSREMAAKLVKRNIIVNAIAPGPYPTWMLSTGVGGGGDAEHTDWDMVESRNPRGASARRRTSPVWRSSCSSPAPSSSVRSSPPTAAPSSADGGSIRTATPAALAGLGGGRGAEDADDDVDEVADEQSVVAAIGHLRSAGQLRGCSAGWR